MNRPQGQYSQISSTGSLFFLAGQAGADRNGTISPDISEQTEQVFENIRLALESQGLGLRNLLNLTIYLVGSELIAPFEEQMEKLGPSLFKDGYPPSTLLIVAGLARPELLVEIAAAAHA